MCLDQFWDAVLVNQLKLNSLIDVMKASRIGLMKARDTAEHNIEVKKKLEDFGVKEMLKKCIIQ